MENSIQELVRRSQRGDGEALEELFELHRDRLARAVGARLRDHGARSLETGEIVQETFSQALGSIDRFSWSGDDSFLRWLCGIARNVTLAAQRGQRKADRLEGNGHLPADVEATPSAAMRREERFDRLREALQGLKAEHREVILLSRIEGLTTAEIAERTGSNPQAVRQLLWRALRSLRRVFGDTESLHLPHRALDPRDLL